MDNKVNAPDQDRRLDVQNNAAVILEAFNVHMEMVNKPDKNKKTEKEKQITNILKKIKHWNTFHNVSPAKTSNPSIRCKVHRAGDNSH